MSIKKIQNKINETLKNGSDRISAKQRGIELFNEFNKESQSNFISNMTLDEINNEIISYRSGKVSKHKDSCKNHADLNKFMSAEKTNTNNRIIDEYLSDSRKDRIF